MRKLNDDQMANLMEKLIKEELIHQYLLNSNIVKSQEFNKIYQEQRAVAQKEYNRVTGKNLTKAPLKKYKRGPGGQL